MTGVSALIARVARGAGWADIRRGLNLTVRIDAEPTGCSSGVSRCPGSAAAGSGTARLGSGIQRDEVRVRSAIRLRLRHPEGR